MTSEEDRHRPGDALDYRTQNLGFSTFATDPSLQSVSFVTEAAQSANYQIGDIVGKSYRLLKQIGRGGMGVVYLAEHIIIGQQYALKILAPNQITATNWARFEIEGRALARIDHPNIVKIFNMGIDQQGCPFYVMDLLPGQSLLDQMDAQSFSQSEILAIYAQVCAGLGSAHKNNIVHRDVKPSNIMLTGEISQKGSVKVVDFGIASMGDNRSSQSLTNFGEVFGSPLYMSPEQCAGEKVDQRSDIYSLGCSLFHSLTGRPPFTGSSALETLTMHVKQPAPRLSDVNPAVNYSESFEHLVEKLLLKNPARRYQTMEQVLHDIERVAADKPIYKSHTLADVEAKSPISEQAATSVDKSMRAARQDEPNRGAAALNIVAGDGESDDNDDDEEDGAPQNQEAHLLKLAVLVLLGLGLVAAAVIGFNAWNNSQRTTLSQASTAPSEQKNDGANEGASSGKPSNSDDVTVGGETTNAHNLIFIQPLTDTENAKTKVVIEKGRAFRKIIFPDTFSIGTIYLKGKTLPNGKPISYSCEGTVKVPADQILILNLDETVAFHPAFLDKLAGENIGEVQLKRIPTGASSVIQHMIRWKALGHLSLNNCSFERNELAIVDLLPHVGALTLEENALELQELAELKIFDRLQALEVSGQQLPESLYSRLANSKILDYLNLSDIDWPTDALATLAQSRRIRCLSIHSDKMTDADVRTICSMAQLERLDVESSKLTEQCVDYFIACKNLKKLNITTVKKWSPESLKRLKTAIPDSQFHDKLDRKPEFQEFTNEIFRRQN
ncbi:MAG: protein kinase [Cyanobacteria bacterium REEB67]|nr:protein kinase [Cyanobacteria bacterium REEB67]